MILTKVFFKSFLFACAFIVAGALDAFATGQYTISLYDQNGFASTAGTSELYTTEGTGVYLDSARTQEMTSGTNGQNPITVPTNSDGWSFYGYYSANEGGTQYIAANGKITSAGLTAAKGYTSDTRWFSRWRKSNACLAGTYRDYHNGNCVTCPVGYYCPRSAYVYNYNAGTDVGLKACSSVGDGTYTQSAIESTKETDCYKTGQTTCANFNPVANQANASGATYVTSGSVSCKQNYGKDCLPAVGVCDITGLNCNSGYSNSPATTKYLVDSSHADMSEDHSYWAALSENGNSTQSYHTIPTDLDSSRNLGEFDVWFNSYGVVHGRSFCSSATSYSAGSSYRADVVEGGTGSACWCKITKVRNISYEWQPVVSDWVRSYASYSDTATCQTSCAQYCAQDSIGVSGPVNIRTQLYSTYGKEYTCAINDSCTVTFKTGDSTMGTQNFTYGTAQQLTNVTSLNNIPVSGNGWTFVGWGTDAGSSATYTNQQSLSDICTTNGQSITLYGIWKRNVSFVYYDGAEATSTTTSTREQFYNNTTASEATLGSVETYALVTQSTYGWKPRGWALNSTTSTTRDIQQTASSGTQTATPAANGAATYYALYYRTAKFSYKANGGTGDTMSNTSGTQYFNSGNSTAKALSLTLSENTYTREGYTFNKWAIGSSSGTQYSAGTSVEFPNNTWETTAQVKVYAKWTPSSYTVHYNLNNGETRSDATWNVGTAYQVTDPTTRSGWTFGGWNITGMDDSTHYYGENSSTTSSTNATSLTPISIALRWFKNLRATPDTVTFSAIWYKSCPRGTYFNDTNDTCTTCPGNGKFCSGTAGVDGNGNQGLSDCPSGYTSDSGAISSYMCYKTGGPYYTTCASANSIATQSNSDGAVYANASNPSNVPCKKYYDYNNSNPTCFPEPGVCDITGLSCDTGYSQGTITGFLNSYVVNVTPSAQPKGFELDGTTDFFSSGANSARSGLANGEFEVYFPYATVRGRAMCSSSSQSVGTVGTPASSSGANCWCKITKVKDSSNKWLPLTSDWVSGSNSLPSVSNCNYSCASICAAAIDSQASEESPAGDALLNSANNRQYQCNANQIYITWEGVASDAKFGNVNANPDTNGKATSTVTYGGDIITPSKAKTQSGMIFLGWKFREAQS